MTHTNLGGLSAFYDPINNRWTPGPNIDEMERDPVLARLEDGRVLVVSSTRNFERSVAKLIDPRQSLLDGMVSDAATPRNGYLPSRTIPARLPGRKILFTEATAEIYLPGPRPSGIDPPDGGKWEEVERCGRADYESCQVLAQLSDGRILARGGYGLRNQDNEFATFLFYPSDGHWHPTGPPNTLAPNGIGVLVADRPGCGDSCNKVLTVGRQNEVPIAELYKPPPP